MINKEDIARAIAKETKYSIKTVMDVLDLVQEETAKQVAKGNSVKIFKGLIFETTYVPEHTKKHPATQEDVTIPGRYKCNARLTPGFKDEIIELQEMQEVEF